MFFVLVGIQSLDCQFAYCLACCTEMNALFNGLCSNYEGKVYSMLYVTESAVSFSVRVEN